MSIALLLFVFVRRHIVDIVVPEKETEMFQSISE